jgi:hypothetical protein
MLVITLPFSVDVLRWAFDRYLPGRLSGTDEIAIAGESTLPLLPNVRHVGDQQLRSGGSRITVCPVHRGPRAGTSPP